MTDDRGNLQTSYHFFCMIQGKWGLYLHLQRKTLNCFLTDLAMCLVV